MPQKSLVDLLDENKEKALAEADKLTSYDSMVDFLAKLHNNSNEYGEQMDPERITRIDHGDYQGTLLYVVGATGYQPSTYWYTRVGYGSCSGCDALESIRSYDDTLSPEQKEALYKLLHDIASGFRLMNDGDPVA